MSNVSESEGLPSSIVMPILPNVIAALLLNPSQKLRPLCRALFLLHNKQVSKTSRPSTEQTDPLQRGADRRNLLGASSLEFKQCLWTANEHLCLSILYVFTCSTLINYHLCTVLLRAVLEVRPRRRRYHLVPATDSFYVRQSC